MSYASASLQNWLMNQKIQDSPKGKEILEKGKIAKIYLNGWMSSFEKIQRLWDNRKCVHLIKEDLLKGKPKFFFLTVTGEEAWSEKTRSIYWGKKLTEPNGVEILKKVEHLPMLPLGSYGYSPPSCFR